MKSYWVRALFIVLVRCLVHTPVRTPMYGLPLSQSDQIIQWYKLLPCLQTLRVSDWDSRTVIGSWFVTWPVQSGAVLTGLPVQKSVLLALVLLSLKCIKQFIQNFIYRCLGGVNINFNRIFQFYDSWNIKFNLHGPAKWKWVHMKIQQVSFVVQGLFFQWSCWDL